MVTAIFSSLATLTQQKVENIKKIPIFIIHFNILLLFIEPECDYAVEDRVPCDLKHQTPTDCQVLVFFIRFSCRLMSLLNSTGSDL